MARKNRVIQNSINIIPLLDVLLVLIVALGICVDVDKINSLSIDLPQASDDYTSKNLDNIVHISIKANLIIINGQSVKISDFKQQIQQFTKSSVFAIDADKKLSYQHIIDVIDIIKLSGFTNVTLMTRNK